MAYIIMGGVHRGDLNLRNHQFLITMLLIVIIIIIIIIEGLSLLNCNTGN